MRIDRRTFSDALIQLSKIAEPRATLPVLRCILLEVLDSIATLTATDLTTRLTCRLPVEGADFTTCVPAKVLSRLVKPDKASDKGTVEVEPLFENKVSVLVDDVVTRLSCHDPSEFPAGVGRDLDWMTLVVWPCQALRDSLGYVLPAISSDATRANLCALLLDEQRMVATDGHRLHMAELPSQLGCRILLPGGAVRALHRLLQAADDVELLRAQDHLRFRLGEWQLDTDLVAETFPNYDQVVPSVDGQAIRVALSTTALTKALHRVGKISDEKHVKMVVNGAITLSVWDADFGEAEVAVPVLYNNHRGEDFVIGFNTVYMHDALVSKREAVELGFIDELGPVRVDVDEGKTAIVMPLRV